MRKKDDPGPSSRSLSGRMPTRTTIAVNFVTVHDFQFGHPGTDCAGLAAARALEQRLLAGCNGAAARLARGPGGRGLGRADYRDHPTAQYRLGRARVRAAAEESEATLHAARYSS